MSTSDPDKTLVVIVGPTAIGKTTLAIELAQHFKTEILSADSRQFYKEMSIGTAKPTAQELSSAPHHFVDFLSIADDYSAGQYERDAITKLTELFLDHDVVIMVGGSGMYVNAVLNGFDELPRSLEIRDELMARLEAEGLEALQDELKTLDPEYYTIVDLQNPQRVVRALEVCLVSGKTFTSFRVGDQAKRPFKIIQIGLTAERLFINERINQRVDQMMGDGLENEVRSLLPHRSLNALKTVGYRELFEYLDGNSSKEEAIENIKKNTRNFAKRQMTWFKRNEDIQWYDLENQTCIIPDLDKRLCQS